VPVEAPLAWPLPLAAGSGSHEGHMLVGVRWKASCVGRKEKMEKRGIEGLREISSVFVFTGDSGLVRQ
jgi:hypothetical protein